MISPTIGRVVLVRLSPQQVDPFPALVTKVWGDRCINVAGFNDGGTAFSVSSCCLIQDDEPRPEVGSFAEWMPYQKAQAEKHAAEAPAPSVVDQLIATAPAFTPTMPTGPGSVGTTA